MSNLKFYTVLCILNILLILYIIIFIFGTIFFTYDNLFNGSDIGFLFCLSFYILCFILKLLQPKILIKLSDKYKNSLINKFVEFLQNNPQMEKIILSIAFCFDLPYILYDAYIYRHYNLLECILTSYLIFYAGGVLFFYIMLYREIKIKEGKIKRFF